GRGRARDPGKVLHDVPCRDRRPAPRLDHRGPASMTAGSTLQQLQAELDDVCAEQSELQLKIRNREVVELANLERVTIEGAHRLRDYMLTSPSRQAASLAAAHGLDPAATLMALNHTVRETLFAIAKGPQQEI